MRASGTGRGAGTATGAMSAAATSPQALSAGRISVAMPGWVRAATMAASAAGPTSSGPVQRRSQCDMGRARLSMSLVSGASYARW